MADLSVYSVTRIEFDIAHGEKQYLLRLDGGRWALTSYPDFRRDLGHASMLWTTALSKALSIIEERAAS